LSSQHKDRHNSCGQSLCSLDRSCTLATLSNAIFSTKIGIC
jgi:hypothetical protein